MSDLISRQAAMDALDKQCDIVCQYSKKQRSVMTEWTDTIWREG